VQNQQIIAAESIVIEGNSRDNLCEIRGVLGLSPHVSIFRHLLDGKLLERNILTLRLREPAQLTLGFIDSQLHRGELEYIPVITASGIGDATTGWKTDAESATLHTFPPRYFNLSGREAVFSTSTAFIRLPLLVMLEIVDALGLEFIPLVPPSAPCRLIHQLPNLTFNFAGYRFNITPNDYMLPWPLKHNHDLTCVCAIESSRDLPNGTAAIVLGSAFIRSFHSVFD
jgi:hypothetical protein